MEDNKQDGARLDVATSLAVPLDSPGVNGDRHGVETGCGRCGKALEADEERDTKRSAVWNASLEAYVCRRCHKQMRKQTSSDAVVQQTEPAKEVESTVESQSEETNNKKRKDKKKKRKDKKKIPGDQNGQAEDEDLAKDEDNNKLPKAKTESDPSNDSRQGLPDPSQQDRQLIPGVNKRNETTQGIVNGNMAIHTAPGSTSTLDVGDRQRLLKDLYRLYPDIGMGQSRGGPRSPSHTDPVPSSLTAHKDGTLRGYFGEVVAAREEDDMRFKKARRWVNSKSFNDAHTEAVELLKRLRTSSSNRTLREDERKRDNVKAPRTRSKESIYASYEVNGKGARGPSNIKIFPVKSGSNVRPSTRGPLSTHSNSRPSGAKVTLSLPSRPRTNDGLRVSSSKTTVRLGDSWGRGALSKSRSTSDFMYTLNDSPAIGPGFSQMPPVDVFDVNSLLGKRYEPRTFGGDDSPAREMIPSASETGLKRAQNIYLSSARPGSPRGKSVGRSQSPARAGSPSGGRSRTTGVAGARPRTLPRKAPKSPLQQMTLWVPGEPTLPGLKDS